MVRRVGREPGGAARRYFEGRLGPRLGRPKPFGRAGREALALVLYRQYRASAARRRPSGGRALGALGGTKPNPGPESLNPNP